ncbi:MAG: DNA-packaging protein [Allorhizobium sp.]
MSAIEKARQAGLEAISAGHRVAGAMVSGTGRAIADPGEERAGILTNDNAEVSAAQSSADLPDGSCTQRPCESDLLQAFEGARNDCRDQGDGAAERGENAVVERVSIHGLILSPVHVSRYGREWSMVGRDAQKPPPGDWRCWLLMGGRGSGKTRAGAEWVHQLAKDSGERSDLRIALVAETLGDAREVMIDGMSGICRVARDKRPQVEISRRRLVWPNGAVAQIFSSEDPESLRGPQFHFAWCDELAKWKYAEETFDMLQFGLRLGQNPRYLVTTTPRPVPVLKRLMADAGTRLTRLSTQSNAKNLSPGFIEALKQRYGGTRLGRQELDGELIEDRQDGLWKRQQIEALLQKSREPLGRIVVAVDPPAGAGAHSCCGIVVAGLQDSGRAVVLADCSLEAASPADWALAVVRAFRRFEADRVVAEINQGGDMVTAMLKSVDAQLPVTTVRATRGKFLRAEPVAALYEQGRVVHAARFIELEDQMCDFGPDGLSSGRSPDRLDALVWALTALLLGSAGEPRVRGV